ncbi:MAG: DUF4065 domain-containing protein [Clostridiaceae bacterium]|nr:DUF4065 domain-containing protein [Clostridiaceae bacterium]
MGNEYNVLDIAKYVIYYCTKKGYLITNLKLQKILYFIQAIFLVNTGSPCFKEEIEAWDFGPVVPEVYHEYKFFGNSNIFLEDEDIPYINKEDKKLMKSMIDECSDYSAAELVSLTHKQAPWKKAYKKYYNNVISKESIREYFED